MNKTILGVLAGALLGGGVVFLATRHAAAPAAAGEEHPAKAAEGAEKHPEGTLKLDHAKQQSAGLELSEAKAARQRPEVKAYGRVMDPAPLALLLNEISLAQASLNVSTKDYERVNALFTQNQNASARAREVAELARQRDQLLLEAARNRLLTSWGQAMADRKDLAATVQSLVAQESALVRVDLSSSETLATLPSGARVFAVGGAGAPMEAEIIGPVPGADPQSPGQGFLLWVKTAAMPPATPVGAYLVTPGEEASGVVVPRAAIVRKDGETYVYVRTGEEIFERKTVLLSRPIADGWFVSEGIAAGDKLVVVGAQQLLSEELKGQGGEE